MYPSRSKSTSTLHDSKLQSPRVRATVLLGVKYSMFHPTTTFLPFSRGWIMDRHESVKEVAAESSFTARCDGVVDCEARVD